jgi:hypothetical protein
LARCANRGLRAVPLDTFLPLGVMKAIILACAGIWDVMRVTVGCFGRFVTRPCDSGRAPVLRCRMATVCFSGSHGKSRQRRKHGITHGYMVVAIRRYEANPSSSIEPVSVGQDTDAVESFSGLCFATDQISRIGISTARALRTPSTSSVIHQATDYS